MSPAGPRRPRPSLRCRAVVVGALALGVLGLPAVRAEAHVTVHPDSTTAGSFSQLTFRVPNESADAGTVKVMVQLPQDKPFRFVSVKPVEGWKATLQEAPLPQPVESEGTTITKSVRTITWTAGRGSQIGPGEYQEFSISAGPLPGAGQLSLPAVQTYSDGKVVSWDQPTPASGEEPERPAPTFEVVAAGEGDGGAASPSGSSSPASEGTAAAGAGASTADPTARWLAAAALLVGLAAGALGALGLRRAARP